jgi:hypothetical protein
MEEQSGNQSSSGRHALRKEHARQPELALSGSGTCDSTDDGFEQPRKLLIRELRKLIVDHVDSEIDVVRRICAADLPQKPVWVFSKQRRIYYILDENGKGTPDWVDVEAILRVLIDDAEEAESLRQKLGELWRLAKGRQRLPAYPDPLAASSHVAKHKGGRHYSEDVPPQPLESAPTARQVDAGSAGGEQLNSLGTEMLLDDNVELEQLTKALKRAREELAREKYERDRVEAAQAARIAQLQTKLDDVRSAAWKREQRQQESLEWYKFAARSGDSAVDQLREVLHLAKETDWRSRDQCAHSIAMFVAYTGAWHKLKRQKKYCEVTAGLKLPSETEILINEPEIDRHEPATAMIIRYLRTFLVVRYRVPTEQPKKIEQEDVDRVVQEGELPSKEMLRTLLINHAILRESFPQLLTIAKGSDQDTTKSDANDKRSELASLAELAFDTIAILHSPRRQLKKQDAETVVIPLPWANPFVA